MYTVTLTSNLGSGEVQQISNIDGTIKNEMNKISSFEFTIYQNNDAYTLIREYNSMIGVYDSVRTAKNLVFYGRVIQSVPQMDSSGMIFKHVICESILGFLNDTISTYYVPNSRDIETYLQQVRINHNDQLTDGTWKDNFRKLHYLNCYHTKSIKDVLPYDSSWNAWQTVAEKYNGYTDVKVINLTNPTYMLYYCARKSATEANASSTTIEFAKNIKSIQQSIDYTNLRTKIIAYGSKIKNSKGNETNKRYGPGTYEYNRGLYGTIAEIITDDSINSDYDSDEISIELDQIAEDYYKKNCKIAESITLSALDLATIGLDYEGFTVGNIYHVVCSPVGIDDFYECIGNTISIGSPEQSTLTLGEKKRSVLANYRRFK